MIFVLQMSRFGSMKQVLVHGFSSQRVRRLASGNFYFKFISSIRQHPICNFYSLQYHDIYWNFHCYQNLYGRESSGLVSIVCNIDSIQPQTLVETGDKESDIKFFRCSL